MRAKSPFFLSGREVIQMGAETERTEKRYVDSGDYTFPLKGTPYPEGPKNQEGQEKAKEPIKNSTQASIR